MIDIFDISGSKITSSEVLNELLITKDCQHVEELMKANYVSLSWKDPKRYKLPVGAYIIPFPNETNPYIVSDSRYPIKYSLYEPYVPEAKSDAEYEYEPEFQHPIMWLSYLPFMLLTGDITTWEEALKKTTWGYTGSAAQLANFIANCINWLSEHNERFAEAFGTGWVAIVDSNLAPSATVSFESVDIMSGASLIAQAFDCEFHFDYARKQFRLGVIRYDTEVTLQTGVNVGGATVNRTKTDFHNAFLIKGGTRNLSQPTDTGENAQVTERLTLDPEKYPDSMMYTDGEGNIITREAFAELGVPALIEELVFDEVYPKLNLYLYNVRERKCWLLDEQKHRIEDPNGLLDPTDNKKYKYYSKWYTRLAYPIYTVDAQGNRTITSWQDYELTPKRIIDGQTVQITFLPNLEEGADPSLLIGQGDFDVVYFDTQTTEKEEDDVNPNGFTAQAGDYRIVFHQTDNLIIPTTSTGGIYPQGEVTPAITNNLATLINVVVDDVYKEQARQDLEMVGKRKVSLLRSDLNNYTLPSNPVYFEENSTALHTGQAVIYNDGQATPYTLSTHILKIVTQIDYPFVKEITVGNQKVKGDISTMKEQIQTILTGGASGTGGLSEAQISNLIQVYGGLYFLSKWNDDTAKGNLTFEKNLKVGKNLDVAGNGSFGGDSRIGGKQTVNEIQSTEYTGDGMLDTGYRLWYQEGRAKLVIDDLVARGKFTVNELETRIWTYAGGNMVFSGAGSTLFFVEYLDASDNPLGYTYINQPWLLRGRALLAGGLAWSKRKAIQRELTEAEKAQVVKFRCYEYSDDGTMQTRNWWKPNDIAMCETLNKVRSKANSDGSYSGSASNTVYKRRVAGIGSKQIPMLNDGRVYDYVDLWNIYDLAGGSCKYKGTDGQEHLITDSVKGYDSSYHDWPAAGDVIVQMGNPLDTDRQSAVTIEVQGDVHGFKVYDTISDYSMANKLWVEIGYDQTTGKAKANVYGDFRFGCRESEEANGGSYVKYNRTTKQLDIRATINAQSTLGSKNLKSLIDEKSTTYHSWGEWVDSDNDNILKVDDLFIPDADTTQSGVTYKQGKIYRCTQVTPSIAFTQILYTDDSSLNGYINAILNGSGASGDAATAAAAQKAILDAIDGVTVVNGGLILSDMLVLRKYNGSGDVHDVSNYTTWSGISGIYDDSVSPVKGHGLAAWYGGAMVDIEDLPNYWTAQQIAAWEALTPAQKAASALVAKSADRFDGSGYRASGNISWDKDGVVTIKGQTIKTANFYLNDVDITAQLNALFDMFEKVNVAAEGQTPYYMIHAKYGIYADGDVQALGYDPQQGGGGGGASVLYELNDVSPNAAHNAVLGIIIDDQNPQGDGYVLTYNYSTKHWYAAPAAETYHLPQATSQALGGIKIGYTTDATNKNYAVALDNDGKAYVNVPWSGGTQSDWDESDSSSLAYIKNKPTDVSAFTNDAGYLTSHQDLDYINWLGNSDARSGSQKDDWTGLRVYGAYPGHGDGYPVSYGNVLRVNGWGCGELLLGWNGDNTTARLYYHSRRDSQEASWGSWKTLAWTSDIPSVPSNISAFTNDSGYITSAGSCSYADSAGSAGSAGSADYATSAGSAGSASYAANGNIPFMLNGATNNLPRICWHIPDVCWCNIAMDTHGNLHLTNSNSVTSQYNSLTVGYLYAQNDVQVTSDERKKDVIKDVDMSVEQIAKMPAVLYRWNDGREDNSIHVGTLAQKWENTLPQAVGIAKDKQHTRSFSYGAAAIVTSIIEAREIVALKKEIAALKEELKQLKSA